MNGNSLFILLFVILCNFCKAQESEFVTGDFSTAQKILINKTYSFTNSPKGYGITHEFPLNNLRSSSYFKEERNTAWFFFSIPFDGILTLEIKPLDIKDDYDFMLFSADSFQKAIQRKELPKLLRSNNARNDEEIKSKTGLKQGFENITESPGLNKSYSKPFMAKRGEKLVLVVDNIYDKGSGFNLTTELKLNPDSAITLTGIISDKDTGKPLIAKVTAEADFEGVKIIETKSDASGKYTLNIPKGTPLNIVLEKQDYLFQTLDVESQTNITQNFSLEKPGFGKKLILYNIHFTPNKDIIQESSEFEVTRLINFLKQQPQWSIKIIGHSNNNVFASARYLQQLSFKRAIAVKNILIQNGISEKRMSCYGMGGKQPLIITKDPVEGLKNLRVEVVLGGK